jgi:hypothetical protein
METCARQVVLLGSAAFTATGAGDAMPGAECYTAMDVLLDVTAKSGTSPTLDVYIQKLMPDNSTYQDLIHFSQVTATGQQLCSFVQQPTATPITPQSKSATANTQVATLLGHTLRVAYTIGGTNPSFTFSVKADFFS